MQHAVLAVVNWLDFGSFKTPQFIKNISEKYKRYQLYRTTLDELSKLSDRELKDMGINRSAIRSIALEVYEA